MICLVKPQFEAGREKVGKKGVVRDQTVHCAVLEQVSGYAIESGFSIRGLDFSPVKGPEGNIEYLMFLCKDGESCPLQTDIPALVEASHKALDKPKVEE